jgi:hypothetical protein
MVDGVTVLGQPPPGWFIQADDYPVFGVSYYEAETFCNWAEVICPRKRSGRKWRVGQTVTRMCTPGVIVGITRSVTAGTTFYTLAIGQRRRAAMRQARVPMVVLTAAVPLTTQITGMFYAGGHGTKTTTLTYAAPSATTIL